MFSRCLDTVNTQQVVDSVQMGNIRIIR